MGLDLTLLPIDSEEAFFSHQVIGVAQCADAFQRIDSLSPQLLEKSIRSYLAFIGDGVVGYGDLSEDRYGEPLKWLFAEQLRGCDLGGTTHSFVNAMPDRARVVLFWH